MSEMVERVARAITDADGDHTVMEHHRRRARAAIEAMREPTDKMVAAITPKFPLDAGLEDLVRRDWYQMIDAALNDTKDPIETIK